ncbi:Por secretion system C-terminal sorting domain-containing protein [Chryseobacterium sp. OV279]|nr:Por secretion system C-terminal sorting domain-containing protein [Chryseobacterium sp. OV279]
MEFNPSYMKHFYNFFSQRNEKVNYLKSTLFGLAVMLGGGSFVSAQVSAYSFAQSSETYTSITGTVLAEATGNTSATNLDSNFYPVTLPFGFVFNGTSYTSLNVSTNGFITFGATAPATSTSSPISGTVAYDGAVSAWGRDLSTVFDINGTTGNISWETVGSAPNREIVIQWKNFRPAYSASTTAAYTFSFQIRLQETSNAIKMVYNSGAFLVGSTAIATTAQIGLRGSTNTDFNNRLNATTLEFINSTAGTANSSTQAANTTNAIPGMPPAGLTYTWSVPTCWMPSGVNVTGATTNLATVNWTAPSPAPANGYEVYYSTSNTVPTASTPATITGITGLSTPLSPLQPATNYFVWVRSVCSTSDKSNWTPLTNFATQCDALPGSYFEGFEGYTGVTNGNAGVLPVCWTNLGSNNGGHISNSTTITGSNTLYMWTSGTRIAYVALPAMSTLQSGTYKLKFDAKASVTANGILQVGYVDPSNNFVQLTTFSVTTTNTVYPFTFDIPALPAGVTQLALKNLGTPANSLSIDNISYEPRTLSTLETAKKDALKIYPNPFSDNISISDADKVKSVIVADVSGRIVKMIDNVSSSVNLSELKTGLYILNVQYKDGTRSSHKIIKK